MWRKDRGIGSSAPRTTIPCLKNDAVVANHPLAVPTCPLNHFGSIWTWRRIMNVVNLRRPRSVASADWNLVFRGRAMVIYAFACSAEMQQACHAAPVFLCAFGGPRRPQIDATMSPDKPSALCYTFSLALSRYSWFIFAFTRARRPSGSSVSAHSLGEIIASVLGIANLHIVPHSFSLCKQYRVWNMDIGDQLHTALLFNMQK